MQQLRAAFERMNVGTVYLLHFDRPISDHHTTQHYLGWARHLPSRIAKHANGSGARLTQVARERGIGFTVARTWPGDRNFERTLKRRKYGPRICPICNPPRGQSERLAALDACI